MKAFLYSSLLGTWLLLATTAAAQNVPNNTLDAWATRAGIEAPTGWLTTDDVLPLLVAGFPRINTGTVTKTTDAHSLPYAASLNTTNVQGQVVLPGLLVLGTRFNVNALGGAPYTTRPTQLQFYYKFSGTAADSATVQVLLTRTKAGQPELVGGNNAYLAPAPNGYTQVTLPILYSLSAQPDSVRLFFSSGQASKLTVGAKLLVDDITFSGTALATRADVEFQQQLTVAPNPSPAGRFVISSPARPELAAAPLTVLDAMGREVLRQPAQAVPTPERALDLSSLALGIYLLRLDSKQGTIVRQLVVK